MNTDLVMRHDYDNSVCEHTGTSYEPERICPAGLFVHEHWVTAPDATEPVDSLLKVRQGILNAGEHMQSILEERYSNRAHDALNDLAAALNHLDLHRGATENDSQSQEEETLDHNARHRRAWTARHRRAWTPDREARTAPSCASWAPQHRLDA